MPFSFVEKLKGRLNVQTETFAKESFSRQPKSKQRFLAVFVSNIH